VRCHAVTKRGEGCNYPGSRRYRCGGDRFDLCDLHARQLGTDGQVFIVGRSPSRDVLIRAEEVAELPPEGSML